MSFLDTAALTRDGEFQERVQVAVVAAALDILGEDPGTSPQASTKRQMLAHRALLDIGSAYGAFTYAVAANPTVVATFADNGRSSAAIPDGDIAYVVSSVWNDIAGVTSFDDQAAPATV